MIKKTESKTTPPASLPETKRVSGLPSYSANKGESGEVHRVYEHPYSRIFYLKNRDPANYVLNKDFFFWCIIALYVFLFWYYILIFNNYEFLNRVTPHNNEGGVVWYGSLVSSVCLFFVMVFGYYQKMKNVYPLLGLGYSLLLTSMGVLIFNFTPNEIERGFEHDPVQITYIFLLLYAFTSFFLI